MNYSAKEKANKGCDGCYFADQYWHCDYILKMKRRRPVKPYPGGGCACYTKHKPKATPDDVTIGLSNRQRRLLALQAGNIKSFSKFLDSSQEAFDLYNAGEPDIVIAHRFDCSKNTITNWRKRNGLPANNTHPQHPKKKKEEK